MRPNLAKEPDLAAARGLPIGNLTDLNLIGNRHVANFPADQLLRKLLVIIRRHAPLDDNSLSVLNDFQFFKLADSLCAKDTVALLRISSAATKDMALFLLPV